MTRDGIPPRGRPESPFIGIDVVDLGQARALGRSRDERFLARVFSEREQEKIAHADDPDLEVWRLWACKEAAFKVVSKLELDAGRKLPVFRHAAFEVVDAPRTRSSRLRFEEWDLEVEVIGADHEPWQGRVVAIASASPLGPAGSGITAEVARTSELLARLDLSSDWRSWLGDRLTPAEAEPVHSLPSALARVLVRKAAAEALQLDESRLSILCPPGHTGLRPPYLHLDGELVPHADISISHDGESLAWTVRWFGDGTLERDPP